MNQQLTGLHHVTAIASDPQRTVDFYTIVLGLKLVKLTVNFDDPTTYHLYFGDDLGRPGTILTFFPWPKGRSGQIGSGMTGRVSFSIPIGSLDIWADYLLGHLVDLGAQSTRFGDRCLSLSDPDGMVIELVESCTIEEPFESSTIVSRSHPIRSLHSVALIENDHETTGQMLTRELGFRLIDEESGLFRYAIGDDPGASFVDIEEDLTIRPGRQGVGTIHHVAFRTPNEQSQFLWHQAISGLQVNVSPVMDRQYFRSIYFREPGGVLFEIATDPPGFLIDEAPDKLGTSLQLPPQYEEFRSKIEASLVPLQLNPALV